MQTLNSLWNPLTCHPVYNMNADSRSDGRCLRKKREESPNSVEQCAG
jgi:hypothetical protein